jgi:hypothetical protein
MQEADSISASVNPSMDISSTTQASQQEQQAQQQQLSLEPQRFTVVTLRKFLQSPDCMQALRRMGSATVEELAGG